MDGIKQIGVPTGFSKFGKSDIIYLSVIVVLFIILLIVGLSGGTGIKQREKAAKEEIKRLDGIIKGQQQEKRQLNDTIAYYKNEVIENKKRDTIVIYKIKQLHYEAKQSTAAIDNMPPDSVHLLFSKYAAEYAIDDSIRNAEAR